MPLEVGGALRSRLEAAAFASRLRRGKEDRGRRSEVRDQPPSLKLRREEDRRQTTEDRRRTEDRRQEAYAVGGWRSAALEVGGTRLRQGYGAARKTEVGGQKAEISRLRLMASARQGGQRAEDRGRRSEISRLRLMASARQGGQREDCRF